MVDCCDGSVSGNAPVAFHGERFSCVLVNDVQQLEAAAISGLIKLEIKCPYMIFMLGS